MLAINTSLDIARQLILRLLYQHRKRYPNFVIGCMNIVFRVTCFGCTLTWNYIFCVRNGSFSLSTAHPTLRMVREGTTQYIAVQNNMCLQKMQVLYVKPLSYID
jgi:hypothetical protein